MGSLLNIKIMYISIIFIFLAIISLPIIIFSPFMGLCLFAIFCIGMGLSLICLEITWFLSGKKLLFNTTFKDINKIIIGKIQKDNNKGNFESLSNINPIFIKSPFELDVFIFYIIFQYLIFMMFFFIIVLIAFLSSDEFRFINFISGFLALSLILFIPINLFLIPLVYHYYYYLTKRDYYIQNGIIHIGDTPFFILIFLDDIINIKYVEVNPLFLIFRYFKYYHGYYHQYINPPMSKRVYLIDLVENHKLEYEGKIYRVHNFNEKDWKKVSYRYIVIPKIVFDEYKKQGYYLSPNLSLMLK